MSTDASLWVYFADASLVVKCIMLLLLVASIASWTIIFQRWNYIKRSRKNATRFEDQFWSGADLNKLYDGIENRAEELNGLEHIFSSGLREFNRLSSQSHVDRETVMDAAQRAMRVANTRELDKAEKNLSFLATVGSTSPYVGLFGTVWGIMAAFHALGAVQQATIAMVAPGISEALIATAMGLFAAIPAVIAYNRYQNDVERIANQYDTFTEELTSILQRQLHAA